MLDRGPSAAEPARPRGGVLASGYVPEPPRRGGSGQKTKGCRGRSAGKVWLLTIQGVGWRASGGERVGEIGPLPISPGERYTAQYMEAIFTPGMIASAHRHAGPEAWYTLAGETFLETPEGKQGGRAGGQHVIVPGGPPMHLTATSTEQRRALVLILYESAKPATTLAHHWTPKGYARTEFPNGK
jgi:quercetin dioxygenase-like cupin family protein